MREGNLWYIEDYYAHEQVLQMTGRYADDSLTRKEGVFYYYHKNSKLEEVAHYKNGLLEGWSLRYDSTGGLLDSTFYRNDQPSRYSFGWAENGRLSYRGIFDEEGKGTGEAWHYHDNGNLCCHGKRSAGNVPDSVWTFYYREGGISCKDTYLQGKYKSRVCYDPGDSTKPVKCKKSDMPRSLKREIRKAFAAQKESMLKCKEDVKGKKGRLVVDVCVEIDGTVNATIVQPFHPCVDGHLAQFLNGIKVPPQIGHNRPERECKAMPLDFN
jgi:antitoxin component YwqK of YwqJK toxin-antitoxin module